MANRTHNKTACKHYYDQYTRVEYWYGDMTEMKEEHVIWITNMQLSAEVAQIHLIWKYISEQDSAYTDLFGHSQRTVIHKENHVNVNFMVRQGLL
jgi:hypothetical protein